MFVVLTICIEICNSDHMSSFRKLKSSSHYTLWSVRSESCAVLVRLASFTSTAAHTTNVYSSQPTTQPADSPQSS